MCGVLLLIAQSVCLYSVAPARQQNTDMMTCTGSTKGQACKNRALPFTQHCFQRILSSHDWLYNWLPQVQKNGFYQAQLYIIFKITYCALSLCGGVLWSHAVFQLYWVISFIVLCRHSFESFAAALCELHSQICRWSAVLHPRLWHYAPDTTLWRACQKNGEFIISYLK